MSVTEAALGSGEKVFVNGWFASFSLQCGASGHIGRVAQLVTWI